MASVFVLLLREVVHAASTLAEQVGQGRPQCVIMLSCTPWRLDLLCSICKKQSFLLSDFGPISNARPAASAEREAEREAMAPV